jgi:hypothetical protein
MNDDPFADLIPKQDDDPFADLVPANRPGALGSAAIGAADVGTFGFGDEIVGGMSAVEEKLRGNAKPWGDLYAAGRDRARGVLKAAEQEHPGAVLGGRVAGGAASMVLPGVNIMRGVSLLGKAVNAGLTGGLFSGLYGAGTDDGTWTERLKAGAAAAPLGVGLGMGGAMLGRGIGAAVNRVRMSRAIENTPSIAQIKDKAGRLYDAAEQSGVVVKKDAFTDLAATVGTKLDDAGFEPAIHTRLAAALNKIKGVTDHNPTAKKIMHMRRMFQTALESPAKDERRLAGIAKKTVDEILTGLSPANMVAGDAGAFVNTIKKADKLWTRQARAGDIAKAMTKADNSASGYAASGLDNALRARFRGLADNPKIFDRLIQTEKDAVMAVVRPTRTQSMLQKVGKFSPTSGFFGGAAGLGATAWNPAAAVIPAAGYLAKTASEGITKRNAQIADALIRGGKLPLNVKEGALEQIIRALISRQGPAAMSLSN